ncbi:Asp23/Gls24 family envelope stress response protein [Aeromicrobium piscarium]|uniref:Asp23/Gls24 family envelope stress response protein n=1 Tax=Aeromicrobium piscarium TaxID=2590901 RepID=A0A554SPU0_9ACTN|nr:Asp23/Gls24 family envelope stress response protein [Aeromicrobium piscarium]TSD68372.1 Asp23/Gls24 family envelope stress response protein [Aeromicrobium piscarium]
MTDTSSDPSAETIAEAVQAIDGVHSLHGGLFGEVATYLPGGRVSGVRIGDDGVDVHIVVRTGRPVLPVAEAVRAAVEAITVGPTHVTVEDLADVTGD